MSPTRFLRLEGLTLLAIAVVVYRWLHLHDASALGWGWFFALFLAPDIAMVGYLRSTTLGANLYNVAHTETAAAVLLGVGWFGSSAITASIALIWFAHIGFDRAAGYGLKFVTAFNDTHLGRVGRGADAGSAVQRVHS